jgi:hypothetical protein
VQALAKPINDLAGERREYNHHPHRARNADGRRAAHGKRPNRVTDLVERPKIALDKCTRQASLIDDAHGATIGTPVHRSNRLHGVKVADGR